jgi:7-carboxy-7-deazaguanine synthase
MQFNVCEIFQSIQGETSFAGLPTTFIRLSGCPLQCSWCDTPYAKHESTQMSLTEIVDMVNNFGWKYVCVTGGEPLAQQYTPALIQELLNNDYIVSLETNGAMAIDEVPYKTYIILDVKCPGSGMSTKNIIENLTKLRQHDEVKFVLADDQDYLWAKDMIFQYNLFQKVQHVLLSCVWGKLSPQDLVSWIQKDKLPVRVNVQLHKYLWDPKTRGV